MVDSVLIRQYVQGRALIERGWRSERGPLKGMPEAETGDGEKLLFGASYLRRIEQE